MTVIERIEKTRVNDDPLDLLFRKARTHNAWLPKPVPDELIHQLYDTLKWDPQAQIAVPRRSYAAPVRKRMRDPLYLFVCHLAWRREGNLGAYQDLLAALDDPRSEVRILAESLLHRRCPRPD